MEDLSPFWDQLIDELLPVVADCRAQLSRLDVEVKRDETLLTQADLDVQDRVLRQISAIEAQPQIVAEEQGVRLVGAGSGSGRVWVVDSIDGTSELVRPTDRE